MKKNLKEIWREKIEKNEMQNEVKERGKNKKDRGKKWKEKRWKKL